MPGRRPGRMRWPAPNSPFNSFVLFGVAGLLRARLESAASLAGGSSSIRSCFGEWRSGLKKLYKQLRNLCRLLVQEPVCGIGEGEEFAMSAIAQAFASHFWDQEFVTLAPQDARGHAHGGVGETRAIAQGRAIPVDHRGEGARLRPSGTVLRKIVGRKRAGAARANERARANVETRCGKDGFRQPRNLKEKDVPASQYLPGLRRQKAAHNRGMRHIDHGAVCKRDFLKGSFHGTRVYYGKEGSPRFDRVHLRPLV